MCGFINATNHHINKRGPIYRPRLLFVGCSSDNRKKNSKLQALPVLCSGQVGTLPNLAMPSNHPYHSHCSPTTPIILISPIAPLWGYKAQKKRGTKFLSFSLVPGAGIEPAQG